MSNVKSLDEARAKKLAQNLASPAELARSLEAQRAALKLLRESAEDDDPERASVALTLLEALQPALCAFRNEIKAILKICSARQ